MIILVLFISTDGQDLPLGSYVYDGTLAAGATYTKTVTVSIPDAIYGNFTVIVLTDAFNNVYEHTTENDNIGISRVSTALLSSLYNMVHLHTHTHACTRKHTHTHTHMHTHMHMHTL